MATARGTVHLVGRDTELRELGADLGRAARGAFSTILISGEPGVGKTRLVRELLERSRPRALGLSARAYVLGGTASFGLWVEALEPPLRTVTTDELTELCGGFLDDLASLFRSVAAARGGPPSAEPPSLRLLEGLAVLLENLSRRRPVVLFLDDLHLADASSIEALQYMSRRLAHAPVLVVAAARPIELGANQLAGEVVQRLEQDGQLRRMNLAPLGRDSLRGLAEQTLTGPPPTDGLIDWLEERSRGHPLFALELLRALVEEGSDLEAPHLRRLPDDLSARVTARARGLDEDALAVLEVLAVHGQRAGLREIGRLVEPSPDRLVASLDTLIGSRLVIEEERGREVTYEIAHPLIQEAIYERISAARRRTVHRRVARVLVESGRFAAAGPHFAESADVGDGEAIEALRIALDQARARELHREAIEILRSLMEVLPTGDARWLDVLEVLVWQGSAFLDHKADIDRTTIPTALRQIEGVLAGSDDLARLAALQYCRSHYLTFDEGRLDEARSASEEALRLYQRAGDTAGGLVATHQLTWIVGFSGNLGGQERAARELVEQARTAGDCNMIALGQTVLGYACFLQGRFDAAEGALRESIQMAKREGQVSRVASNLSILAQTLALEGRMREAGDLLTEARAGGTASGFTLLLDMSARIRWLAGDFEGAISDALEATSWTRGGLGRRRAWSVAVAAMAAAEMGHLEAAHAHLQRAKAAYAGGEWYAASHHCDWAEGVLAFHSGDHQRAERRLLDAADRLSAIGCHPLAALVLNDLAEITAQRENRELTMKADTRLRDIAERLDRPLYQALAHLSSAGLAVAADRHVDAVAHAEEGLARLQGSGYHAFQARALEMLGRALAVPDRSTAARVLSEARAAYAAIGAVVREKRVDRMLGRLGHSGRRSRLYGLGAASLSRRERQVTRLALEGLTARDIGERLFIGERTVETHLANAYAKVGVTSRLELIKHSAELDL